MAWRFDGVDDQMQFAIAPFSGHTIGGFTYATLLKFTNAAAANLALGGLFTSSVTARGYMYLLRSTSTTSTPVFSVAASVPQAPFTLTQGNWYLIAVTKASGTNVCRFHSYDGTTWTHSNSATTAANFTVAGTDLLLLGQNIGNWLKADLVCYGIKETDSADLTVETLSMTSFPAWTAFGFTWLAGFDTTAAIQDQGTPGTGDEISRAGGVGASLVADPPGWSWSAAVSAFVPQIAIA